MIIKNLTVSYGDKQVYDNFNLKVEENKILVVLGESGSGKTTLLNAIAGLIKYSGAIEDNLQPISMLFREDRLIPNLTVEKNLKLTCSGIDIQNELLAFGLQGEENSYPKSLSAGMSRRVSLIRALNAKYNLLLMDEPFINLDLALKYKLINLIKERHVKQPKTTVIVTHDIKEAVLLADRIIVLKKGEIVFETVNNGDKTEKELFDVMINVGNEIIKSN